MISSIRENRRIRGEQKTMRDRNGDYGYQQSNPLVFEDSMSKKEHWLHQQEWKSRRRKTKIKLGVLFVLLITIVSVGLIWLAS